ncbi:GNAT family N-acetyltransferase [Herbaspirillum robiniae]|uniref:GNAT family N-acetyltransferase n=1 Tax=Herbaspirillum robiniae TaxID=2014887 RepID=UPI003D771266
MSSSSSSFLHHPLLPGELVELQPLTAGHRAALLEAAADGELWNMTLTVVPGEQTVDKYLATALEGQAAGKVMAFLVVDRASGRPIGTTRYWKLDAANRKLEIGHTWLSLSFQRSGANTEAKFLLLRHAFEEMGCVRAQFTTDVLNERSRAAILRIGARQEGIVRHERIMPDGRKRDSVRFSIIDEEWPEVRVGLLRRMGRS